MANWETVGEGYTPARDDDYCYECRLELGDGDCDRCCDLALEKTAAAFAGAADDDPALD